MALYAVGDLQGCLEPLQRLLDRVHFDPAQDRLWLVGDLVNRGPDSLGCLRFVHSLGAAAVTVLGNHDLHLLALHAGVHKPRRRDTIQPILDSPDREPLMHWLRQQPILHHDAAAGWTLVHAGLPPQWDLATALACAEELHQKLRGPDYRTLLQRMYGDQPKRWDPALSGWSRLRFITNCFTRLRYCTHDGTLDMDHKGPPGTQPPGLLPWFQVPGRASADLKLVVGHWSAIGHRYEHQVLTLDTGCVWGGRMTLARLDRPTPEIIQQTC